MSKNADKSISEKITELNTMVEWFEGEGFVLEQATEKFKQAQTLAQEIEQDLLGLQNEIKVIKQKFDEA